MRLWSVMAQLGVRRVVLTNAWRVEKAYFSSQARRKIPAGSQKGGCPFLWCILLGCLDFNFLPTDGASVLNHYKLNFFSRGAESNRVLPVAVLGNHQKADSKKVAFKW